MRLRVRAGISRRTMVSGLGAGVLLGAVGSAGVAGAASPLTQAEKDALVEAITDEYEARDTYQAVIDSFGSIVPFANIVSAEQQHISALANLFTRYGLAVPADPYGVTRPYPVAPATKAECCQLGVQAEEYNVAMYDRLLKVVKSRRDVVNVFTNLRAASLTKHLPAFQRCAV